MSTAFMSYPIGSASPRAIARAGGFFWLLTFVGGLTSMVVGGRLIVSGDAAATAANLLSKESLYRTAVAAELLGGATYLAATLFVYVLLKPVNRSISLLAAFFSLVGCASAAVVFTLTLAPLALLGRSQLLSVFSAEQLQAAVSAALAMRLQANTFPFLYFGLHCLLVGYLILRSTFLPRLIGALMVFAGLGWMTYSLTTIISPPLGGALVPWIFMPGMIGEASLTLWLLIAGVNAQRWFEKSNSSLRPPLSSPV